MPASNLPDIRHTRSSSLTTLSPSNGHLAPDSLGAMATPQRFDGPRSPPNTSHVPCKFFRQGACQAGNSCPFSHDIGAATETVCKYFAKGNCKFGPKCANIHVLPDGRRVNYGKNGVSIGNTPLGLGSRTSPAAYGQSSNSALTNSFLANAAAQPPFSPSQPFSTDERLYSHQLGRQPSIDGNLPTIDTTFPSNPASAYGSPPGPGLAPGGNLDDHSRVGLSLSPVNAKVLSVMDVPLPASFDSNGISHAARYGPWPASVPSQFGIDLPSPSLHNTKDDRTSETLKLLHNSAFGSSDHLSSIPHDSISGSSPTALGVFAGLTSFGGHDEFFGKRTMHSGSNRYAKPRLLSSSAPKVDRDWDTEFLFLEEDCVPANLANEVLTPQEKARRGSIRHNDSDGPSETPTASNPASANATKFGCPATNVAASPSRWSPWFQQRQQQPPTRGDDDLESGSLGRPMKHAASAFGHVGSPLRNSSLASNGLGGIGSIGDANGHGHADPTSRSFSRSASITGTESMSVLTQQLQRTRLNDDGSSHASPRLHPNAARNPSVSLNTTSAAGIIGRDRSERSGVERHASSGSMGASAAGRFPKPIDEEDPAFLFSMEEEDESAAPSARTARQKPGAIGSLGSLSGNNSAGGSLWSYAGIVSGGKAAPESRDPASQAGSIGSR